MTFQIREWNEKAAQWGEAYCPYDAPENKLCDDMEDAYEKATFAFTDAGASVDRTGDDTFRCQGKEYLVVIENDSDE